MPLMFLSALLLIPQLENQLYEMVKCHRMSGLEMSETERKREREWASERGKEGKIEAWECDLSSSQ